MCVREGNIESENHRRLCDVNFEEVTQGESPKMCDPNPSAIHRVGLAVNTIPHFLFSRACLLVWENRMRLEGIPSLLSQDQTGLSFKPSQTPFSFQKEEIDECHLASEPFPCSNRLKCVWFRAHVCVLTRCRKLNQTEKHIFPPRKDVGKD